MHITYKDHSLLPSINILYYYYYYYYCEIPSVAGPSNIDVHNINNIKEYECKCAYLCLNYYLYSRNT